jgi:hypothetical protein
LLNTEGERKGLLVLFKQNKTEKNGIAIELGPVHDAGFCLKDV